MVWTPQRRIWRQQRKHPAPLAAAAGLRRGLVLAYNPAAGSAEAIFGDKLSALGSGASIASTAAGRALSFTGGQATGAASFGATWDRLGGAVALTLAFYLKPDSLTSGSFFAKWGGGANILLCTLTGSGNVAFIAGDLSSFRNGVQTSGGTLAVGKASLVIWTWALFPNNAVYIDGNSLSLSGYADAAPSSITSLGSSTASSVAQFGIASDGGPYSGAVIGAWAWNRALSPAEARTLTDNVWQLYAPPSRRIFFVTPAGGGTTYTFGVSGNVALSGAAALLKTKLQVPSGSIAFSGTNSLRKTKIQLVSGSVAFSGTAAQLHARTYAPSGQLLFSGAATLGRIRTQLASGTLTLSGAAAQVRAKVLAPSGQIVFSGTAPISTGAAKILSAGGSIVFAGAASLLRTRQVLPAGTILFSGAQQFARVRNYAPSGALTFTGTATQIHTNVSIPSGNITFSGTSSITFIPFGAPTTVQISRLTTGVNRASRLS